MRDRQTDTEADKLRQTEKKRQRDRQIDRQAGRPTDRQTDKESEGEREKKCKRTKYTGDLLISALSPIAVSLACLVLRAKVSLPDTT